MSNKKFSVDEEFIMSAYKAACGTWRSKLEGKFPELFTPPFKVGDRIVITRTWIESNIELNTWYKRDAYRGALVFVTSVEGKISKGYGFTSTGGWMDDYRANINNSPMTKATDEEVLERLKAEATKRGLVAGAKVRCLVTGDFISTLTDKEPKTYRAEGVFSLHFGSDDIMNFTTVFRNGKWAEPIEIIEASNESLEVGKWYKRDGELLVWNGGKDTYGFNVSGVWGEGYIFSYSRVDIATDKEVEEALLAEAARRGFVKGAEISITEYLWDNSYSGDTEGNIAVAHSPVFKNGVSETLHMKCAEGNICIFIEGEWAKVAPKSKAKDMTLSEIAAKLGYDVKVVKE